MPGSQQYFFWCADKSLIKILGPQDLHLVERANLGVRADGTTSEPGDGLGRGAVVDLEALRKARDAA